MPKIRAQTVRAHRELMAEALVDAAEAALAESEPVTVADLAARVGIARNSFYKHFDSAAAVVELVAVRGFEEWSRRVGEAVARERDPLARVLAYVDASLDVAAHGEHAWRAGLARTSFDDAARARVTALHEGVTQHLYAALEPVGMPKPQFAVASIQALVGVGISALDAGENPAATREYVRRAVTLLMSMGRPETRVDSAAD